jgi:hypothetical protein
MSLSILFAWRPGRRPSTSAHQTDISAVFAAKARIRSGVAAAAGHTHLGSMAVVAATFVTEAKQ